MVDEKHAYLIMAHKSEEQLCRLIKLLDDERNDIFIHIDKKCREIHEKKLEIVAEKSKLIIIREITIHWGSDSIMRCELALLKAAAGGHYAYYHLLSGEDLPIMSQDEIHAFFRENEGKEFIHFYSGEVKKNSAVYRRVSLYHWIRRRNMITRIFDKLSCLIQEVCRVDRWKKQERVLMFGANWFSMTDSLAAYILEHEKWLRHAFCNSHCCDECFLQTLVFNSDFVKKLYRNGFDNSYEANMRYIEWEGTKKSWHPKTFRLRDYEDIIHSGRCFARKFNSEIDRAVIDSICMKIQKSAIIKEDKRHNKIL